MSRHTSARSNPLSLIMTADESREAQRADDDDDIGLPSVRLDQSSKSSSRSSSVSSSSYRRNNPYSSPPSNPVEVASDGRRSAHSGRSSVSTPHSAHSGDENGGDARIKIAAARVGGNPLIEDDVERDEEALSIAGDEVAFQFSLPKSSSSAGQNNDESSNDRDESDFSTSNFLASGAMLAAPVLDGLETKSLWVNDGHHHHHLYKDQSALAVADLTSLPNPKAAVCTSGSIPITPAELEALVAAAPATENVSCPAGWTFSVYDSDISQHYAIESKDVSITQGAIKYVDFFQKYGTQTRFRFQLCKRFLSGWCAGGAACQYIHSQVLSHSTQVHVNENCATSASNTFLTPEMVQGGNNSLGYQTIPSGVVFPVYPPNSANVSPQSIPSEKILVTTGAQNVFNVLQSRGGDAAACTSMKPRHCAHFQFKRMCNLGTECNFIHSLVPYIQGVSNSAVDPYRPQGQQQPLPHQQLSQPHQQLSQPHQQLSQPHQQLPQLHQPQHVHHVLQHHAGSPLPHHMMQFAPQSTFPQPSAPLYGGPHVTYVPAPQGMTYGTQLAQYGPPPPMAPQYAAAQSGPGYAIPQQPHFHQHAQPQPTFHQHHHHQHNLQTQSSPRPIFQGVPYQGYQPTGGPMPQQQQQQQQLVYFHPQPVAMPQYMQVPGGPGAMPPAATPGGGMVQYYHPHAQAQTQQPQPQQQQQPYLQFQYQ